MAIESSLILLATLGVGLAIGAVLMNLLGRRAGRADRERADQLETELEQTREELEVHREDVARHFQQTSDLFRDVTEHYTRLYAHLATGARAFSTDEVPALDAGLQLPGDQGEDEHVPHQVVQVDVHEQGKGNPPDQAPCRGRRELELSNDLFAKTGRGDGRERR